MSRASSPQATHPGEIPQPVWQRLSFRFLLCYLVLYCVSVAGDVVSFCLTLFSAPLPFQTPFPFLVWAHVVPWFGRHILHLGAVSVSRFGSGDTLYDWLQLLCEALLAASAAILWTAIDRTRRRTDIFYLWVRFTVRTLLAAEMLLYGLDKVFPLQFHEMTLSRMMQPMASKTPMGVLWDFMAASVAYTIFTGFIEVLGGILLLVPSWTTLGALLCMVAMTNVFALNLAYDIPVKHVSSHLLLLSIFLVAPAVPRLVRFFLLNRDVPAQPEPPLARNLRINRLALWFPVVLAAVLCTAGCTYGIKTLRKQREARLLQSRFYGAWDFDDFTVADPSGPLFTRKLIADMHIPPSARWRRLILDRRHTALIELTGGILDTVDIKDDDDTLTVTDSGDPQWNCILKLQKTAPGSMSMDGTINGIPAHATLVRVDETQFLLTKRTFHWVNEW